MVEPEWPQADVIIGNPPFLGDKKMRAELGDKYVEDLRKLYGDRIPGQSDLVCYFFEKARAMIEGGKAKRAGLLATQAIRHGSNRKVLDRIKESGNIFLGYSNREWILDGASVRVSMIGFDGGFEKIFELDGSNVPSINPDLTSEINLTAAQKLKENKGLAFIGTQKGGAFDIDEVTAKIMLSTTGNPHHKPNSDVIRPWINGSDITGRPSGKWIIFFGTNMSMQDASLYEKPFEYVKKIVKTSREDIKSEERSTARWWLHQRPRPEMWAAISGKSRYVVTPRVAKHRLFVWVPPITIPDSRLVVIAREDDYFLGILQSHVHEIWGLEMGSRHGDGGEDGRPVYNAESCFETFPFPWAPGKEPMDDPRVQAIAWAAKELVEQRDRWLNADLTPSPSTLTGTRPKRRREQRTLTNLYNARPTWLDLAHRRLDEAVFAAYGWKPDLSDEEILEKLLALNLDRSKA